MVLHTLFINISFSVRCNLTWRWPFDMAELYTAFYFIFVTFVQFLYVEFDLKIELIKNVLLICLLWYLKINSYCYLPKLYMWLSKMKSGDIQNTLLCITPFWGICNYGFECTHQASTFHSKYLFLPLALG